MRLEIIHNKHQFPDIVRSLATSGYTKKNPVSSNTARVLKFIVM